MPFKKKDALKGQKSSLPGSMGNHNTVHIVTDGVGLHSNHGTTLPTFTSSEGKGTPQPGKGNKVSVTNNPINLRFTELDPATQSFQQRLSHSNVSGTTMGSVPYHWMNMEK